VAARDFIGKDPIMVAIRWLLRGLLFSFLFVALNQLIIPAVLAQADNVPRISVQELKVRMDKGEDIVIIDVRAGREYTESKIKIKGAIRIPIVKFDDRYKELPPDKDIVTYCT